MWPLLYHTTNQQDCFVLGLLAAKPEENIFHACWSTVHYLATLLVSVISVIVVDKLLQLCDYRNATCAADFTQQIERRGTHVQCQAKFRASPNHVGCSLSQNTSFKVNILQLLSLHTKRGEASTGTDTVLFTVTVFEYCVEDWFSK